jgi:hypothetical protein
MAPIMRDWGGERYLAPMLFFSGDYFIGNRLLQNNVAAQGRILG